jgi:hypothetical protein
MISRFKFAVYADNERGRYPIWQSLDLEVPGSGVIFATVTVAIASSNLGETLLTGIPG